MSGLLEKSFFWQNGFWQRQGKEELKTYSDEKEGIVSKIPLRYNGFCWHRSLKISIPTQQPCFFAHTWEFSFTYFGFLFSATMSVNLLYQTNMEAKVKFSVAVLNN